MFDLKIYKKGIISAKKITDVRHCSENEKVWIDVSGFNEDDLLKLKEEFSLHSLTVEDCQRARTRIKVEEFRKYTYIVIKTVLPKNRKRSRRKYSFEQVNFIIGPNFIITLSYKKLKSIERLKNDKKKLLALFEKGTGLEFIAHHLIDMEVDRYFPYLDEIEEEIEEAEQNVFIKEQRNVLEFVTYLKKEVLDVRKIVSAMREVIRTLSTREVRFLDSETMIYFRDVHDHIIRLMEMIDSFRDLITSSLEVQIALSSHRMNDIMRVLTIITTLIMPLTLITGFYGMNFKFMAEFDWVHGRFLVVTVMVTVELLMLYFFKRKEWI